MASTERFSPRNIYLYLVCLISLVIFIFATVNAVSSTVELLYPDPGFYGTSPGGTGFDATQQASRDAAAQKSTRRQSVLSLVSAGTTLLVVGPVYVYHWRRIQRERPQQGAPQSSVPEPLAE